MRDNNFLWLTIGTVWWHVHKRPTVWYHTLTIHTLSCNNSRPENTHFTLARAFRCENRKQLVLIRARSVLIKLYCEKIKTRKQKIFFQFYLFIKLMENPTRYKRQVFSRYIKSLKVIKIFFYEFLIAIQRRPPIFSQNIKSEKKTFLLQFVDISYSRFRWKFIFPLCI